MFVGKDKILMRYSFLVFISLCMAIAGCNKEDDYDQVFLLNRETKCGNLWGNTSDVSMIKDYLISEGLQILEIKRMENSIYSQYQPCDGFSCSTGAAVLIGVDYDNLFKVLRLGFTTINGEELCG